MIFTDNLSMKVCIVTPEFPPAQWGGLARTVRRVSLCALAMGLDVHVAHFTVVDAPLVLLDENRVTEKIDGMTVHRLLVGREDLAGRSSDLWEGLHNRTIKMMYQSLQMLDEDEGFELFHSFFLYPIGYISGILAKKKGRPFIATIVGNDINKYIFSPEKTAMCRSGLENADCVAALSHDLLATANALVPVFQKGQVIYNSVSIPDEKWKGSQGPEGSFRIGCAGIFKYAKGLPYLFKAVDELSMKYKVVLELAGTIRDSEQEAFDLMLGRTAIGGRLVVRSPIPHNELTQWLISLSAFVLPSLSEGCPNILMEVMACGIPCVATKVGAVDALMTDGLSGWVVPWGNARALAQGLERIILAPDQGASLGAAAREAMRGFSAEREMQAWKGVYQRLLGI